MNWNDLLIKLKRYDHNATVIFDHEEPIGRPTDLVLPEKRGFGKMIKRLIRRPAVIWEAKR
jgi:hypothetical protein